MLYLLYTSGTTAKPKGILHTTAGYLLGTSFTHEMIFDLKPDDVYWCAADIGWVTGHSYIVYGPLANGATGVMYEGAPDTPTWDRWWQIVEDYKVSILYMAPTAIRAFMKQGRSTRPPTTSRRCGSSARSASRSTPRPGSGTTSTSVGGQAPDRRHVVADRDGDDPDHAAARRDDHEARFGDVPVPRHQGRRRRRRRRSRCRSAAVATSSCKQPWPAMLRGIYGDPERYKQTYWSRFPGMYFAGDGAKRDEEGYYWLLGRVDDVMNVAGHRISTTEVESALVDHRSVAEAAVVGVKDDVSGQAIYAFVILKTDGRAIRRPRPSSSASTWPTSSARSPGPSTSCSCPTCPRPAPARSCAGSCATSPRAGPSATRRPSRMPPLWIRSVRTRDARRSRATCRSASDARRTRRRPWIRRSPGSDSAADAAWSAPGPFPRLHRGLAPRGRDEHLRAASSTS